MDEFESGGESLAAYLDFGWGPWEGLEFERRSFCYAGENGDVLSLATFFSASEETAAAIREHFSCGAILRSKTVVLQAFKIPSFHLNRPTNVPVLL